MKHTIKAIFTLAFAATVATAQDTNFAVRISCDFQQQAGAAELPDLTLLQGSAPMIQAAPMRMGRAVAADSLTTCQLVFGPSATSTYYVATNAYLATNSAYYVQLGTIGTNSVPAGSNAPAAWWYSLLFYRNGGIYWSGSGRLYIERTTATGTNGLVWQEWEAGAAKDDIARGWIALLSNELANVEAGGVNYGTTSNAAYRGDWGLAASNLAAQAAGWGNHASAGYLTAETDAAGLAAAAGVQSNLTAHAEDVENPHAVTAEQIGALTEFTDLETDYGITLGTMAYEDSDDYILNVIGGDAAYAIIGANNQNYSGLLIWDNIEKNYLRLDYNDRDFYFGPTNTARIALWSILGNTNVWQGRINDAEANRIAAIAEASGGISASTATGIAQAVSTSYGFAPTSSVQEIAGQIATNVASGYLPLSGYAGLVVLGTRTRGYAASTNLGDYGFAAGDGTSAGDYGFAAGAGTSAGYAGFAAGESTTAGYAGFAAGAGTSAGDFGFAAGSGSSAGEYGFAAGSGSSAGDYGFAAGAVTSAGEYGFAAGLETSAGDFGFAAGAAARGADGSFVFADNSTGGESFNRTNYPNSFSLRVAGGIYAEIGTNVFAVSNAVTMNGVELGAGGGSGISAAESGQIATNVATSYGFAPTSSVQEIAGQAATNVATSYGFATTSAVQSIAGLIASNVIVDEESDPVWTNWLATEFTNAIDGRVSAIAASGSPAGAESSPRTYAWATNIVLLGNTSLWQQAIASIDGTTVIVPPAKTTTNASAQIWLSVPATGTNAVAIATAAPPVVGYVPTLSTGAASELLFFSPSATTNWRVRKLQ